MPILETWRLQVEPAHGVDHGADAAAAVLDQMRVLHQAHQDAIARRLFFFQGFFGDVAVEATRALYLQPVGEKPNLDVAAPHVGAVVAMGNCVDNGFPHPFFGVFGDVATQETLDHAALADAGHHIVDRRFDHVWDRPFELAVVQEALAAWRLLRLIGAVVMQEGDDQLRLEGLGVDAEHQQAGQGRADDAIHVADDAQLL